MLIRTKQIRSNHPVDGHGTDVELGKGKDRVTLRFRPLDKSKPHLDHVCEVENPEHVAQLLAIPSGFEIHPSQLGSDSVGSQDKVANRGSGEQKEPSAGASSLSDAELEAELARRRTAKPQGVSGAVAAAAGTASAGEPSENGGDSKAELSKNEPTAAVTKKTGKKPHQSTSVKKLQELLAGK